MEQGCDSARPGPEGGAERAEDNHRGDVGTEICMGGRRPLLRSPQVLGEGGGRPSAATAILFVLNGQAVVQQFTRSSHGKPEGSDPTGAGGGLYYVQFAYSPCICGALSRSSPSLKTNLGDSKLR